MSQFSVVQLCECNAHTWSDRALKFVVFERVSLFAEQALHLVEFKGI